MSLTLRLLIPADWPSQRSACEWALCNARGEVLQRGCSEPRHWPTAESCEVILTAEQTLLLAVPLPKGARARTQEVIAYAVEEQLIGEVEADYFVLGEQVTAQTDSAASLTAVWVIARARMRALLAALASFDRAPVRVLSELQLLPVPTGGWLLALRSTENPQTVGAEYWQGFVRQGTEVGFSCGVDDLVQPPLELQLAVRAATPAPSHLTVSVHVAKDTQSRFDAAAWQAALGLPVHVQEEYQWQQCGAVGARNLLTGEFAPKARAQGHWRSFKPAAWLALATVLLYAGFSFAEWFWLAQQSRQLRQQMRDSFQMAAPNTTAIVDAPLQMQRLHDQLRRERGQLGAMDFLPLLAAASEVFAGQGKLRSVAYEDGRLELVLWLANPSAAEALRSQMQRRGLQVVLRATRAQAGNVVEAVFVLRGQA